MRRIAAARLADGWVRELSSRPPEILFWGASVSHEVKCFSVGQRVMSVPISAINFSAVYGRDAVNLGEVDAAGELMQRRRGSRSAVRCRRAGGGRGGAGSGVGGAPLGGGQALHVGLDGAIAGGQLVLTGVEELEILLQDEECSGR